MFIMIEIDDMNFIIDFQNIRNKILKDKVSNIIAKLLINDQFKKPKVEKS